MIDFPSSFAQFILATFIPVYLGMFFVILLREAGVGIRNLSAFAFGVLLWFFLDTLNDAIQLGVNEGYTFSFRHAGLLLLFVVGFLSLALLSGLGVSDKKAARVASSYPLLVAMLAALGMGFHGVAEGLGFGATVAGTPATSILDAVGGYGGGVSYVLHKFLEASIVLIIFLASSADVRYRKKLWEIVAVGLAFGIPSAAGDVVGYYVPVDASYFFALGAGAALFVALLVTKAIFGGDREMNRLQWVKIALSLLLGFLSLYAAAAFHSG